MMPMRNGAFLQRLAQNTSGNTLAIMAAAFFPLAGLIGGGVDMTRIYITKTRLQQACDAGALAGRKVMAAGSWTTSGAESSRGRAYQMFAANFASGDFGTEGLSREFTESDGTVTGVASADVPMTIMRVFGKETQDVSVTCTARMEIPNTDVMFVLDVTYSMQTDNRIGGLKSATKCFYEALLKVNTSEVCGGDPTATTYNGTAQIRLGFVPFAVNVNVGKLLPNAYMADSWDYQTRQANSNTVYAWQASAIGSTDWGDWSDPPANLADGSQYSSWDDLSGTGNFTINGTAYAKRPTGHDSSSCNALNDLGTYNNMLAYVSDSGDLGPVQEDGTSSAPVYPQTSQTVNYEQEEDFEVVGYRYRWVNGSWWSPGTCRLQESGDRNYSIEREGTATRAITWTEYQQFTNYTYAKLELPVSGLKDGGSSWNGTVSIPNLTTTTVPGVKLSGSNNTITLTIPAAATVTWDGCIEERPTWKNTDGTPDEDEWDPIPAEAQDLVINHVPSDATKAQAWGPMLERAVWGRMSGGSRSFNPVNATSDSGFFRAYNGSTFSNRYWCPTAARKLAEYNTLGDFETYINSFQATSLGTYHDIGLLWGARMLSPTGIFGSENAMTADGGAIERHLIFMTDGDVQTVADNLDAYGLSWWDRRQTTYVPDTNDLDALVESRLPAICTAIKNMNIKLWVISFGGDVTNDNNTRLESCASPGNYFLAEDNAQLMARFKQIASEIADLRLTE